MRLPHITLNFKMIFVQYCAQGTAVRDGLTILDHQQTRPELSGQFSQVKGRVVLFVFFFTTEERNFKMYIFFVGFLYPVATGII